jgi:hypothetical protein
MGLQQQGPSVTYVNITKGKLAIKKQDKTVETFDSLTGHLSGIEIKEDEYQGTKFEKLELTLDDDSRYILQMRLDSGYARGFLFAIKNADLSQPMTIIPNSKEVNGKSQNTVFLKQGNTSLKWVWTKDHPGDLPQLSKVVVKGKDVWDNTDQMNYLKEMLQKEIIPKLGTPAPKVEVQKGRVLITEPIGDDNADDLPF